MAAPGSTMQWLVAASRTLRQARRCQALAAAQTRGFAVDAEVAPLKASEKYAKLSEELWQAIQANTPRSPETESLYKLREEGEKMKALVAEFKAKPDPDAVEYFDKIMPYVPTDEVRREVASIRSLIVDHRSKFDVKPLEPIDWESYKKEIDPKVVTIFKQAYETMPIPEYDDKQFLEQFKAMEAEMVEQYEAECEAELAGLEEAIAKEKENYPPIYTEEELRKDPEKMLKETVDEILAAEPELAAEIDKEISEGKWY